MPKVYINGEYAEEKDAKISVFDHGFLYGDGIFETLRAYSGQLFRLDDHLNRLFASAEKISLSIPWDRGELSDILADCLRKNALENAVLRITLSRGEGPQGLDPDLCKEPTLVVISRPFEGYPQSMVDQGISIALVQVIKVAPDALDSTIKSLNFLNNILAKIEAKKSRADEAIMTNHQGYLAEGTVSNLFLVRNGTLCTPSMETGILLGVTRNVVLELANQKGIPVLEDHLLREDLFSAEEVFVTNTTYEVMAVTKINDKMLQTGPVTRELQKAFRKYVHQYRGRI